MKNRALAGAALATMFTSAFAFTPAASVETEAVPRPLTGEAVYFAYNHGFSVDRYVPRKGFVRIGAPSDNSQFAASPDGRKVAWVTQRGEVKVKAGTRVTTVARNVPTGIPCLTPAWSPDSKQVAFVATAKADAVTVVNADGTGGHKAGKTPGVCHLTWSGGGRYLAGYTGTADAVYKLDLKTGKPAKVKGTRAVTHVQSLSPDGRRVIVNVVPVGQPTGDGGWPTAFRPTIVDTVSGEKVAISVKGRLLGAFYLPDGRLVVRVAGTTRNTLVVLDKNGEESQRLAEPAGARKQGLLQVVG
ncbi:LpqB family beta-propeller domain-containing protein [Sphaerisporangium sp. NPDC088356]|uniref:LpqB family beta-propeller domain-containing protein n=1 Tax=Sphaerisporangium sp. NPDC088356 TaxID=3154871 RepID=UPI003420A9A7